MLHTCLCAYKKKKKKKKKKEKSTQKKGLLFFIIMNFFSLRKVGSFCYFRKYRVPQDGARVWGRGGGGDGWLRMQPCELHCFHMKSLNKTKTPIFDLLRVLCFLRQPLYPLFGFLLYGTTIHVCHILFEIGKYITKTCLYNVDPLKPHFYIVKTGVYMVYIIFVFSAQNIDCGYSLEPPRRGGSNEYPQSMF